jgi:hypothetical protein
VETGQVVGRAVGLAAKTEQGKGSMTDHALAAIAQARAQRNALRSCLGAILIAAGFEVVDPEGPATREQLARLHILEREIGATPEEGHAMAGVGSYTRLTRDQASDLIERWEAITVETSDGGGDVPRGKAADPVADRPEPGGVVQSSLSAPPGSTTLDEAWSRAPKEMKRVEAIRLAKLLVDNGEMDGPVPTSQSTFTAEQVGKVSAAWRDGRRGRSQ